MVRKSTMALAAQLAVLSAALAGCQAGSPDPRGVDHDETLLSVSTTGHAEARPDKAEFQAGVQTFDKSAKAASQANARKIGEIVAALKEQGVAEKDIQTRSVSVARQDWGDKQGQFAAYNTVNVIVRDVDKAGAAVSAATDAGANIVSGPDLSMAAPEVTANIAYANAFKAARARADAYAKAAGMTVSRVLSIRDAGGQQGQTWLPAAERVMVQSAVAVPPGIVAPPPPAPPGIMPGQTASDVSIQVDFALRGT